MFTIGTKSRVSFHKSRWCKRVWSFKDFQQGNAFPNSTHTKSMYVLLGEGYLFSEHSFLVKIQSLSPITVFTCIWCTNWFLFTIFVLSPFTWGIRGLQKIQGALWALRYKGLKAFSFFPYGIQCWNWGI